MLNTREPIVLERDTDAVLIPAGTPVRIPGGTEVTVTQSLGGTFTVFVNGNLARIDGQDADALGLEVVTKAQQKKTADGPVVTARFVMVATNSPMNDIVTMHTKQAPYHTYVIGLRAPAGALTPALYWDTLEPFHYVRVLPDGPGGDDVLIVGGEDHKAAHEADGDRRWKALEHWARAHFPSAGAVGWHAIPYS